MLEKKMTPIYLKRLTNLKLNFCVRRRCQKEFHVGDDIVVCAANKAFIHKIKRYHKSCFEAMSY